MNAQQERYRKVTALIGVSAIVLGAFGAHGLEDRLSAEMMEVYQTGVLYHLIHAVALLGLVLAPVWENRNTSRIAACWVAGILIFSGSLYALAISGVGALGAITPIGGVAFIVGWSLVFGLKPNDATR